MSRQNRSVDACTDHHSDLMISVPELTAATESVFERVARGLRRWPDPHQGGPPGDDDYSVATDAAKWRIIGARVDAWFETLETNGLARIERDAAVDWVELPGTIISRVDRAVPRTVGALPLVVARSAVGDVEDAGVTVGAGDPATLVAWVPDCGCDACDRGSQPELDEIDRIITSVISGTFRRLESGDRAVTQLDVDGWSASGVFSKDEVDRILEDPSGWVELSGPPWLP